MSIQGAIEFGDLRNANLVVDAVYKGGTRGDVRDDPIARLLPCGNQGGFRIRRDRTSRDYRLAVLYTSGDDPDWPDVLDQELGQFTYFGDNKTPGQELHETSRGGNALLRFSFDAVHDDPPRRSEVPPYFIFEKTGTGRDVRFRGLAVPGSETSTARDDLVAVWRSTRGERFQNYRSVFTVLDVPVIERSRLDSLSSLKGHEQWNGPADWLNWVDSGKYNPLRAPHTIQHRDKVAQVPASKRGRDVVRAVYEYFKDDPYAFEYCAVELWRMLDINVAEAEVTRRSRDGGRDATGTYRIGPRSDSIRLEFAVEAKCYAPDNGVGVKETSRLISRLRHRQFGVLVTTSYVGAQAYEELREDEHPVVIISSSDIANILSEHGISTAGAARAWLKREFPSGTVR